MLHDFIMNWKWTRRFFFYYFSSILPPKYYLMYIWIDLLCCHSTKVVSSREPCYEVFAYLYVNHVHVLTTGGINTNNFKNCNLEDSTFCRLNNFYESNWRMGCCSKFIHPENLDFFFDIAINKFSMMPSFCMKKPKKLLFFFSIKHQSSNK